MAGRMEQGNVVRDFLIGNTHIKICDDYCRDRTPDEIDRIMKRIARQALEQFSAVSASDLTKQIDYDQ